MGRPTASPRSRRGAALAFGLAVALLGVEVAARVADLDGRWMPSLLWVNAADAEFLVPSSTPGLVYELAPSLSLDVKPIPGWGDPSRHVSTNSLGLRGPERPVAKPPGTLRIVCIGASNTYGAAVTDGHTWPDALERSLVLRGIRAEVWNSGVSAWVTTQAVIRADRALAAWEPDLLLFQLFNTGPRNIIGSDYEEVPWRPQFAREPGLWGEQLRWVPDGGAGLALVRGSAGIRGVALAANLWNRSLEPDDRSWIISMEEAARVRGERAYVGLRGRWPGAKMALVVVPAGGHEEWWDEPRDGPVLDLRALPRPNLPGIDDIHPGWEAYAWYGEELARMLLCDPAIRLLEVPRRARELACGAPAPTTPGGPSLPPPDAAAPTP
jgi:hypothetical protein